MIHVLISNFWERNTIRLPKKKIVPRESAKLTFYHYIPGDPDLTTHKLHRCTVLSIDTALVSVIQYRCLNIDTFIV